jgi:hypothetical protein
MATTASVSRRALAHSYLLLPSSHSSRAHPLSTSCPAPQGIVSSRPCGACTTILLVGYVGVVSGIFPPKTTDMPTCWRHVADTTQTMSATLHRVGSSDAVSVSCRHDDLPTCWRRVGKKTTNSTTILCNNQINNSDAVVALGDETAARWRLGRRVGRQLKVTAALGRGGSGGR